MDWLTTLRRSGGINALSRQLGLSPADVAKGAEALLPALVGGLRQFADALGGGDTGLHGLVDALKTLGGGDMAAAVMAPDPMARSTICLPGSTRCWASACCPAWRCSSAAISPRARWAAASQEAAG